MTRVWEGNAGLARLLAPVGDMRTHPRNPRRGNVAAIQDSLTRFGQQRPILATTDGTIVAGNHTYLAAVENGWTHVAVVRSDLTDTEIDAYLAADNRLSDLGTYDDSDLGALLESLRDDEQGLAGTGYDDKFLTGLLADIRRKENPREPDAVVAPPEIPKSLPGEIYELGPHRLMCGDSTDPEAVGALLAGAEPMLMLTDPPYGVSLDMEWRDRAGHNKLADAETSYMRPRGEGHTNVSMAGDTKADWSDAFEVVPSLRIAYVWHASSHACEVQAGLERIGFRIVQQVIWVKTLFAMSRQRYHWQHEACWYAVRGKGKVPWFGGFKQSTIWEAASPKMIMGGSDEAKIDHPTQKPVVLYTRAIQNHLEPGEVFYEPFGGSGSGLIAAEMTGRVCLAMELDPVYCDVIRQRYADYTGDERWEP